MTGILTGWKTWAGGLVLIFTGIAGVLGLTAKAITDAIEGRYTEAVNQFASVGFAGATASIGMGLGILGIGDKQERAAVGELGPEVKAAEKAAEKAAKES